MRKLEKLALAEEVASVLRHDLRNKMGSIRNAAFYLRRRFKDCEAWQTDPRVSTFFELIDKELGAAEEILSGRERLGLPDRAPQRIRVGAIVADALGPGIDADIGDRAETQADPGDVRLLTAALVDYARESGASAIRLRTLDVPGGIMLELELPGVKTAPTVDHLVAHAKGLDALALRSVRRLAGRNFATLSIEPEGDLVIRILFGAAK